jgi:hypothetical protein
MLVFLILAWADRWASVDQETKPRNRCGRCRSSGRARHCSAVVCATADSPGSVHDLPRADALTPGYALCTHCLPCGWHLLTLATLRRYYETLPRRALLTVLTAAEEMRPLNRTAFDGLVGCVCHEGILPIRVSENRRRLPAARGQYYWCPRRTISGRSRCGLVAEVHAPVAW